MKLCSLGMAAVFAVSAVPVAAATTVYSEAGSFVSASGTTNVADFQGCAGGGTNAASFCTGLPDGVSFTSTDFYTAPPLQSSNPTTALGVNTPLGGINTITFASGTSAFGLDLFQNFGGGSQSGAPTSFLISLFGASNTLIGTFNPLVAPNGGSFFGVISSDAIFSAQVSQPSGFAVIDNVRFGSVSGAVPEPATWALLLIGFGFVGGAMRIRRRKPCVSVATA